MTFTVNGELDGIPVEVSWVDGDLGGDAAAIARVQELVTLAETVWATPTGPHYTASLEDPAAALVTLATVLDRGTMTASGDLPERDADVPEGAIP